MGQKAAPSKNYFSEVPEVPEVGPNRKPMTSCTLQRCDFPYSDQQIYQMIKTWGPTLPWYIPIDERRRQDGIEAEEEDTTSGVSSERIETIQSKRYRNDASHGLWSNTRMTKKQRNEGVRAALVGARGYEARQGSPEPPHDDAEDDEDDDDEEVDDSDDDDDDHDPDNDDENVDDEAIEDETVDDEKVAVDEDEDDDDDDDDEESDHEDESSDGGEDDSQTEFDDEIMSKAWWKKEQARRRSNQAKRGASIIRKRKAQKKLVKKVTSSSKKSQRTEPDSNDAIYISRRALCAYLSVNLKFSLGQRRALRFLIGGSRMALQKCEDTIYIKRRVLVDFFEGNYQYSQGQRHSLCSFIEDFAYYS